MRFVKDNVLEHVNLELGLEAWSMLMGEEKAVLPGTVCKGEGIRSVYSVYTVFSPCRMSWRIVWQNLNLQREQCRFYSDLLLLQGCVCVCVLSY